MILPKTIVHCKVLKHNEISVKDSVVSFTRNPIELVHIN
jgi:hypothetical protein